MKNIKNLQVCNFENNKENDSLFNGKSEDFEIK